MIAEVAFHLPVERTFHYLIPEPLEPTLQAGMRVLAPFGKRERIGIVVRLVTRSPVSSLKSLRRALDTAPVITGERWALAGWLSSSYACSLGEAMFAMVPATFRVPSPNAQKLEAGNRKLEHHLASSFQPPASSFQEDLALSTQQQEALDIIEQELAAPSPKPVLIHGVTASGKTELYLQAIERIIARDSTTERSSALCLLPEIALTPQTIDRFRSRFADRVGLWHSRLSSSQRRREWARCREGSCRVLVGTRSAVFAPLRHVGLIILDEEHETSFKQPQTPRYHAREVALKRAELTGALVILGSATPSIESFYAARQGRFRLVSLPERVEGRALPFVDLIDLREEWRHRGGGGVLSLRLQQALRQVLERGEQAMLLLNRRGFARTAQCRACGEVMRCARCAVPLVYHAGVKGMLCHYCGLRRTPEDVCPSCQKGSMRFRGAGTERVESELHRLFPGCAVARMDRDAMRRRESYREAYDAVVSRQVGVVVGTQMIAKGLDFPQVTLVGVVSADTSLNLPDFRAGERTFDLLTQMAGRAGRGTQPGRVLLQTFCPRHYAIQAAKAHDYRKFYEQEIRMRRRLRLPPFVHLIELTLMGTSRERVETQAARLGQALRDAIGRRRMQVLGPAPPRLASIRRRVRMCLLLKGARVDTMVALIRQVLGPGRTFSNLPVIVDVDPL